jgi:hypothetical protein
MRCDCGVMTSRPASTARLSAADIMARPASFHSAEGFTVPAAVCGCAAQDEDSATTATAANRTRRIGKCSFLRGTRRTIIQARRNRN